MPWAKRIIIKKKQYKQLYLFPLHYCSWFLAFRLSFPQSLAFWLPGKSVLKESSFPSTSMSGLHNCYLHCTDVLLWTMTSLLPCLSPFFWPCSGAWFPEKASLSPGRISFSPPLFPAFLCLLKSSLRVSAPCFVLGWGCALRWRYGNYDCPKQGYPRPSSKHYLLKPNAPSGFRTLWWLHWAKG